MLTVLVVEDDPAHAKLFEEYLRVTGWATVTARNAKQALELAATSDLDAVLLDILLPDMDGREVIVHLRQMPVFTRTPIVAVSALADYSTEQSCMTAGADAFLTKPVALNVLGQCLTALTNSPDL